VKPDEAIRFLRQFQELLAEGGFVATYKFALLQALADLSVEHGSTPDGSLPLHVEQIAEKFIEYYWNQARPFQKQVLRQNTRGQAEVVRLVEEFRKQTDGRLGRLQASQKEWSSLKHRVATIIINMPLWKLQTFGNRQNEFLYRQRDFDDRTIRLLPGVPQAFRTFHPLLTSMIRGAWMTQLHRIKGNRDVLGPGAELEAFLFGTDRSSLTQYRELLRRHQADECFYCGRKVSDEGELDHFIPWSRYPLDLGHNFVFAHKGCNNAKRDYLAASAHIQHWRWQNLDEGHRLAREFDQAGLVHDLDRSLLIARWAYHQGQASEARLWLKKDEFEPCDYRWQAALGAPGGLRLAADETPSGYR